MTKLHTVDWLTELRELKSTTHEGEILIRKAVVNARRCGYPWTAIGEALGMSRQLAFYHYSKYVK